MKNKLRYVILLAVGLTACHDHQLKTQYKAFIGSEVVVPVEVIRNDVDAITHFVVYVDSIECSSCKIGNIYIYDSVVDFCRQTDNRCRPIFVFSPRKADIADVRFKLRRVISEFPILLDSTRSFPKANPHIPADNRLHTFLLDKNGKVVLVGDPAYNPQLWELYKKTITQLIENNGTLAQ
jgi:hypothetical protein